MNQPPPPGWQPPGSSAPWPPAPGPGGYAPGPGYGGGYGGPAPGWQLPPASHKPGIIALRPLRIGDLYDGAFKAIRQNPKTMIGLALVVQTCFVLIPAIGTLVLAALGVLDLSVAGLEYDAETGEDMTSFGLGSSVAQYSGALFSAIATVLLSGFVATVVFGAVLGRRTSPGAAWTQVRGRLLPLIGLTLLIGTIEFLPVVLIAGVVVAAVFADLTVAAIIIGVVGFLAWVCWLLTCLAKFRCATPALVLEELGPFAALARSWRLTRGHFWRMLGITLLTALIVGFAAGMLGLPFQILEIIRTVAFWEGQQIAMLSLGLIFLGTVIAAALTAPFDSSVAVLQYLDLRIRREGYDVTLIAASGGDLAGVSSAAPPTYAPRVNQPNPQQPNPQQGYPAYGQPMAPPAQQPGQQPPPPGGPTVW